MFRNVKVLPGVSLDSDHRLLVVDITTPKVEAVKKHKWKIMKADSQKDPDIKASYQERWRKGFIQE